MDAHRWAEVLNPGEREAIEKAAAYYVRNGPMFEAKLRTHKSEDPNFRWLFDEQSAGHMYYEACIAANAQPPAPPPLPTPPSSMPLPYGQSVLPPAGWPALGGAQPPAPPPMPMLPSLAPAPHTQPTLPAPSWPAPEDDMPPLVPHTALPPTPAPHAQPPGWPAAASVHPQAPPTLPPMPAPHGETWPSVGGAQLAPDHADSIPAGLLATLVRRENELYPNRPPFTPLPLSVLSAQGPLPSEPSAELLVAVERYISAELECAARNS